MLPQFEIKITVQIFLPLIYFFRIAEWSRIFFRLFNHLKAKIYKMFNFKAILSKAWVVPLLNMFKAQHVIFKGLKGNRMAYLPTILIL